MNVRVKELMERSMELVDPYALEGEFGPRQLNVEKFAKLLINSCAQLGDYAHIGGVMYPGETIREYFGVE